MEIKDGISSWGLFCVLLSILFISLKLIGVGIVAKWSWWTVLSPLYIPFCIIIIIEMWITFFNKNDRQKQN